MWMQDQLKALQTKLPVKDKQRVVRLLRSCFLNYIYLSFK